MNKNRSWLLLPLLTFATNNARAFVINCAGADLSGLPSAVYVSPQGTDSDSCGQSVTSPCKTIQQGINNCRGDGCGVLVRYGVYDGTPVFLADGVSLYGSCIFDETPYRYRSTVIGRPAMRANGIKKPTKVYGFVILGRSAISAGEGVSAITVSDSTGLILGHDVVASGKGGDGAPGTVTSTGGRGSSGQQPSGNTGGAGGKACSSNPPTDSRGQGGKGADYQQVASSGCNLGGCKCTNNNYSVAENGNASGTILGGIGGAKGDFGSDCEWVDRNAGAGGSGNPGSAGACGAEGGAANQDTRGSFATGGFGTTIWKANSGGTGTHGQVGSGGGGGGSGGYGVVPPKFIGYSATDLPGSTGGGGGGGGCGGPGGPGGQQGGASIPLVLSSSTVTIDANDVIVPGPGGAGGRGGNGGKGGPGGDGNAGGKFEQRKLGNATVPGAGGPGGAGGQGGAGSGGAGGNGGPSFAIALVNSSLPLTGVAIYAGQPGAGGGPGIGGQNNSSQCKAPDGHSGKLGFSSDHSPAVPFNTQQESGSN